MVCTKQDADAIRIQSPGCVVAPIVGNDREIVNPETQRRVMKVQGSGQTVLVEQYVVTKEIAMNPAHRQPLNIPSGEEHFCSIDALE